MNSGQGVLSIYYFSSFLLRQSLSREYYLLPNTSPRARLRGLVAQHPLDLLHDFGRQLVDQREGLEVVLDLLHLGRAQNHSADIGVLGRPRQREVGNRGTEPLGNRRQLAHLFDLGLALGALERLDGVLEE